MCLQSNGTKQVEITFRADLLQNLEDALAHYVGAEADCVGF